MGVRIGLSRVSWKLSRTVLRGGATGNGGSLLDEGTKATRQPLWIRRRDGELLLFAGLYEVWQPKPGESETTFTILTCAANSTVAPIHTRMPVILSERSADDCAPRRRGKEALLGP
jgi:hypothetical protein